MHKYLAFYNGAKAEIEAESLFEAKTKAVAFFKAPKSKAHMVSTHLAEKDGKPVTHTADF